MILDNTNIIYEIIQFFSINEGTQLRLVNKKWRHSVALYWQKQITPYIEKKIELILEEERAAMMKKLGETSVALKSIRKSDIQKLKSLTRFPVSSLPAIECICIILDIRPVKIT